MSKNNPYETYPFEIIGTRLPFTWHHNGDDWPVQVTADGIAIYGCRTQANEYKWIPACVAYTIEGYPIAVVGTERLFVKRLKDKEDREPLP